MRLRAGFFCRTWLSSRSFWLCFKRSRLRAGSSDIFREAVTISLHSEGKKVGSPGYHARGTRAIEKIFFIPVIEAKIPPSPHRSLIMNGPFEVARLN